MSNSSKIFWLIFILIFLSVKIYKLIVCNRHFRTINTAKKIYKRINEIENKNEGWLLSYLRKIDPFAFEELILISFKKKGFKIFRNKRYTGDGGIDGKIQKDGEMFLIQAKRYSDYINIQHVKEFINICETKGMRGYFIHTGKTGAQAYELLREHSVKIISGGKLYSLFIAGNNSGSIFF